VANAPANSAVAPPGLGGVARFPLRGWSAVDFARGHRAVDSAGVGGWRRLRLLCLPLALLPLARLCQLCRLQLRGLLRTVRLQACVQHKLSGRVCLR
jgi:hypothetical protein